VKTRQEAIMLNWVRLLREPFDVGLLYYLGLTLLVFMPGVKLVYIAVEQRRLPDDAWSYAVMGVGALLLVLIHFVERIYRQLTSLMHVVFSCLGDDNEGNISMATFRSLRARLGLDKSTWPEH
jgi:hypothetical protein